MLNMIEYKRYEFMIKVFFNNEKDEGIMVNFKLGENNLHLDFEKVTFFEKLEEKKKVVVHGVDEEIIINATLRDIEDKLGKNFYKCHKNFLVNIDNIADVDKENRIVKMNNNDQCIVGERHLNKLLRILNAD